SREMLLKNCRRKKIAKLEMNSVGSMMPSRVSTRPRFLIRMKLGSRVKICGIISEPRKIMNTVSRPRQRRREKAYAAIAQEKVCTTVMEVATITEFSR